MSFADAGIGAGNKQSRVLEFIHILTLPQSSNPPLSKPLPQLRSNVSLREFNTLGVESIARAYLSVENDQMISALPALVNETDLPVLILGGGSNLVLDSRIEAMVLHIKTQGIEFFAGEEGEVLVRAAAGVNWHHLVRETVEKSLYGLENLSLIPGSVGAAPVQNIGAYGVELADHFHSLEAMDLFTGERRQLDRQACKFGYRDSAFKGELAERWLITSVTFSLRRDAGLNLEYGGLARKVAESGEVKSAELVSRIVSQTRRSKLPDPAVLGNVGSFFKNPVVSREQADRLAERYPEMPVFQLCDGLTSKLPAAWLIERAGLKGLRRGQVGISESHALVLVNYGAGTGLEIMELAAEVTQIVFERFGIELEPEPRAVMGNS